MEIPNQGDVKKIEEISSESNPLFKETRWLRILNRIAGWGAIISGSCLIIGVLLLTTNIIRRSTFHLVMIGVYELTEISMVLAVSFAFAYAETGGTHVLVDSLLNKMPRLFKTAITGFNYLLCIGILAILVYASTDTVITNMAVGEQTDVMRINYVPFRIVYVLGLILWLLIVIAKVFPTVRRALKK